MLVRTCCCQVEPATAPAAAGSPTSAAYPTSISPRKPEDDDTSRGGDGDRKERGRSCCPLGEPRHEDEQRHGDDAAADSEERGEDPRREPDGDEAHTRIVRTWPVGSASSWLSPSSRQSIADELGRPPAAGGDGDLRRPRRHAAVPEPAVRRLLGRDRERRSHAVRATDCGNRAATSLERSTP